MSVYARRGAGWRCAQLAISSIWWLVTLGGRLGPDAVVTLCYHGVLDGQARSFERQARRVRDRSIATAPSIGSRRALQRPRICITFDDAFRNLRHNALPTLRQYRMPAVIFAVSQNAGRPPAWEIDSEHPEAGEPTMTAEELQEVASDLIEIGSHTATHARLTDLGGEKLQEELTRSKGTLESELGREVRFLAFPHGAADSREIEASREAGYACVFTLDPGDRSDFVRGRYLMSPDVWPLEFALTADGAYSWVVVIRGLRNAAHRLVRRFGGRCPDGEPAA